MAIMGRYPSNTPVPFMAAVAFCMRRSTASDFPRASRNLLPTKPSSWKDFTTTAAACRPSLAACCARPFFVRRASSMSLKGLEIHRLTGSTRRDAPMNRTVILMSMTDMKIMVPNTEVNRVVIMERPYPANPFMVSSSLPRCAMMSPLLCSSSAGMESLMAFLPTATRSSMTTLDDILNFVSMDMVWKGAARKGAAIIHASRFQNAPSTAVAASSVSPVSFPITMSSIRYAMVARTLGM